MPAAPALAATGISSPADGAVIDGGSSVRLSADTGFLRHGSLRLRGPGDDRAYTVDEGDGRLSYPLDLSCPDYAGTCTGTHPAANGTYTATLTSGLLFQRTHDLRTFRLRVPPRAPAGVHAKASGPRQVLLRWKRGSASDLASYDVLSASGRLLAKKLPVSRTCHDGGCAAVLGVSAGNAGEKVGFRVRARRHTAPGSKATVASAPSSPAAVVLPAPRNRGPSPGIHTQSADEPSSAGSASPSSSSFDSADPTLPAGLVRPKVDLPALRPLASTSALKLPDVARNSNDVFKPRLTYPAPELSHGSAASPSSHYRAETAGDQSAALQPTDWWKSVALGLVLLLVAAHLGAWSWRVRPARSRRSADGGAAPTSDAEGFSSGRGADRVGAYHGRRRR